MRGHPVAAALIDTIRRAHLPRGALTDMVEARRADLYDEPIESLADYAARADRIEGARITLAAQALAGGRDPGVGDMARHAGRALAAVETLRALASPATPLHVTMPLDILRRHGIGSAELLVRRLTPAIAAAVADLAAYGLAEVAALRRGRAGLDPAAAAAFLPSNLAAPVLARAARPGFDPFTQAATLPPWREQWALWRAARRGGVR